MVAARREMECSGREMEWSMVVKGYFSFVSKCLIKKVKILGKHNQTLILGCDTICAHFIFCATFKLLKVKKRWVGELCIKHMLKWTHIPTHANIL